VATTLTPAAIAKEISRRDPHFRALVKHVGPPPRRRSQPVDQRFATLASSITSQLLSTKAAATIHQRVVDLCHGQVTAQTLHDVGHDPLRRAGLSHAKADAMLDLAQRTLDGRLQLSRHGRMTDHEVEKEVAAVRGVGPWTAHMYLMHTLARQDVWPTGDYGVRAGWSHLHGDVEIISARDLLAEGEVFVGVRSDVAWYCWQALHLKRSQ